MRILKQNNTFFLLFTFIQLFFGPVWSIASLDEDISRDFRQVVAKVVSKDSNKFILNVGENAGINPGDIFSLINKDEPVFQKRTKKIIGYKQRVVSKCQVIQVLNKKSICQAYNKILTSPVEALRFSYVKASLFKDNKLISPTLPGLPLKRLIPHIRWFEPSLGPSPIVSKRSMDAFGLDLIFQLKDNKLTVFGPGLKPIKVYNYVITGSKTIQDNHYEQVETERLSQHKSKPIFNFLEAKIIGSLKDKVIQMDIADLDNDGKKEIIYLLSDKFLIAPFKKKGQLVTYPLSEFEKYCSFSINPESGFLILNSLIDSAGLSSKLFKFQNNNLILIQDEINLWLNFVKTNCNSNQLTLLGQSFERERLRGETTYKITPTDYGIIYDEPVHYPSDFSIQCVQPFILKNNTCGIYYLSFDGFLKYYAEGTHLWTSIQPIATSNNCGPKNTSIIYLNGYLIINGTIKENGTEQGALFSFLPKGSLDLTRIDFNLKGIISGISLLDDYVIICVVAKDKKGYKSTLYQFDKKKILKRLEAY